MPFFSKQSAASAPPHRTILYFYVSVDRIAQLEFPISIYLTHDKRGIRNLERQLAEARALFAQAVGLVCVCKDGGEDPARMARRQQGGPALTSQRR